MIRSSIKTAFRRAQETLAQSKEDALPAAKTAVRAIDKAAAKHVVHKNRAARKKSRLMRKQNAAAAGK